MNFPLASLARPPARHPTVAGFRSPSFRPPCIHEAHFRHRGAPVSGFLRPSATVAAWHPGPAESFRGKASVRLGFARLHPRPGNGGDAAEHLPPPRQPAAARARSRLSLSASGSASPTQAGPPRTKHLCQYAGPSDNRALCKVADLCRPCPSTLRCASPTVT